MWQRVGPASGQLLERAYQVLANLHPRWASADEVKSWIQNRNVSLFYGEFPDYRLVIGFRRAVSGNHWMIATLSATGGISREMLQAAVNKAVEFAQEEDIGEMFAHVSDLPESDPRRMALVALLETARESPGIAAVEVTPSGAAKNVRIAFD